jgi:hypothetical protein
MNHCVSHYPILSFILPLYLSCCLFLCLMVYIQCNSISLNICHCLPWIRYPWILTSLGKWYNDISMCLQIRSWLLGLPMAILDVRSNWVPLVVKLRNAKREHLFIFETNTYSGTELGWQGCSGSFPFPFLQVPPLLPLPHFSSSSPSFFPLGQ